MVDLKLDEPSTEEVFVDAETMKAIERGCADADAGKLVPAEDVRRRVAEWTAKYSTPLPR